MPPRGQVVQYEQEEEATANSGHGGQVSQSSMNQLEFLREIQAQAQRKANAEANAKANENGNTQGGAKEKEKEKGKKWCWSTQSCINRCECTMIS